MLKSIPKDVWVVAVAGTAVLMAFGAPVVLALGNVALCIYNAKASPLVGKDGFFSKN